MTERLSVLAARYASVDIDLATDLRSVSLERHETDIAIRMGNPEDGDVIAKPPVHVHIGFYGTDEACRRIEAEGEPVFVGFDEADAFIPEAAAQPRVPPRAPGVPGE